MRRRKWLKGRREGKYLKFNCKEGEALPALYNHQYLTNITGRWILDGQNGGRTHPVTRGPSHNSGSGYSNRLPFLLTTLEGQERLGGLMNDTNLTGHLLLVTAHAARKEKEKSLEGDGVWRANTGASRFPCLSP